MPNMKFIWDVLHETFENDTKWIMEMDDLLSIRLTVWQQILSKTDSVA